MGFKKAADVGVKLALDPAAHVGFVRDGNRAGGGGRCCTEQGRQARQARRRGGQGGFGHVSVLPPTTVDACGFTTRRRLVVAA